MHWIPPPEGIPRGAQFIGVISRSGNNVRTAPLTILFIHGVQSWGHYSHFTLPTTLNSTYHMVTHVLPIGLPSVTSRRASARQGPRFCPRITDSLMASVSMITSYLR
jgi:hypothetical protein